ncbi:hypothetical protein FMUAM8_30850 [Nocardia cyriacigeorgica]|nr:hypothetical protein FMUAM8_30850 [Nocardia cyriacigeorgica]
MAASGFVAFWAIAGFVGLAGGGADLGSDITARLPFESPGLAGALLLVIVGIPMAWTCAVAVSRPAKASFLAMASGLLLVAWVCVQPIVIGRIHWLQIAFGLMGVTVALLGAGTRSQHSPPIAHST